MNQGKQSVEAYHLNAAAGLIGQARDHIAKTAAALQIEPLKPVYKTPQWHHTVLWAGFMFITGMLLGAVLMAQ